MRKAAVRTTDTAGEQPAAPVPRPRSRFGFRARRAGGGYTRFVALMRVLLPVTAGVLVLLVVIWPQFQQETRKFRLGPSTLAMQDGGGQQALNPRFTGTDVQNRPYNVTADSATQNQENPEDVDLAFPKADITLKDGSWVALTAERGRFRRQTQTLDLGGGVNLFHDSGFEFRTAGIRIDFGEARADGDDPVQGQGPFGAIASEGFRVMDGGKRVLFSGKAKVVFWPHAKDGAGKGKRKPPATRAKGSKG